MLCWAARLDTLIFPGFEKAISAVSSGHGKSPPLPLSLPFLPALTPPFPREKKSYVDCKPSGSDFLTPTNRVRDTLEQIDIAKLMIARYDDVFEFATTAQGVRDAVRAGKVASLLGVEGLVAFFVSFFLMGAKGD